MEITFTLTQADIDRIGIENVMKLLNGSSTSTVSTGVQFKGSASYVQQNNNPALQYHEKESRAQEFNRKFGVAYCSGQYDLNELNKFKNYYLGPSKDNPNKTALETMKYWKFEDRLKAWFDRIK